MAKTREAIAMKYTWLQYVITEPGETANWSIHRERCRGIPRDARKHAAESATVEAESVSEVIGQILNSEMRELGWDESAVHVHGCATTMTTYHIEYYPADGCSYDRARDLRPLDGRYYDSIAAARAAIHARIGDYGSYRDPDGNENWYENDRDGCGGYSIVRDDHE